MLQGIWHSVGGPENAHCWEGGTLGVPCPNAARPSKYSSPGDVNVRSAMLRALRRWPIAFCARVSTEKIKNQLNQLYTFRSLHSKHADINITNPLTLTCKANIVTCWIRLGQVRTLMHNAMFFHEVLQLKSCLLSHMSSAGRSKLCCVRAGFTKKHKHMLLTMNVMSGNSTIRVFAFSWSFCTSQCVATFFWFTCFQNPVENHFWCPIGLLYAINRGQNDLDKCAQHGSWLTFFGPVDLSLRLNSFLLSFRLLTNEQPHPMPNQNTQSKQSRDTWKKQLQHVTRCREKASFSLLAEFHLLSLPNWGRVPLTVQRQKQTNFKHFQKTTWLPRDFVNVDCELWPVKAFCWILPAFGFGHLVGKAGYRFRLMLSVAICAISSK